MYRDSFGDFDTASAYVLDKGKAVDSYVRYMLVRTQAMFEYQGLPDTIPQSKLEYLLQTKGSCFVTEVEGKLYALSGNAGGELDVYGDPTQYTVSNTALKLTKTYDIEKDGVLMRNDAFEVGLLPLLQKYGALLAENTLSMRTILIVLRMVLIISASDDMTAASAQKFIKDIESGKFSAVGESAFFEGLKVQTTPNTQNYLTQFMEMEQYLRGSCYNDIGLASQYNMKRANLTEREVAKDDDVLLPLIDNMIKERQTAIEAINEKYGTDISIDYASSWKIAHAQNEKEIALSEAVTEEVQTGEIQVTSAEVNDRNVGLTNVGGGPSESVGGGSEGESSVDEPASEDEASTPEPDTGRNSEHPAGDEQPHQGDGTAADGEDPPSASPQDNDAHGTGPDGGPSVEDKENEDSNSSTDSEGPGQGLDKEGQRQGPVEEGPGKNPVEEGQRPGPVEVEEEKDRDRDKS